MATMAAMSPLVGTLTADVVATASAVMTVPTKLTNYTKGLRESNDSTINLIGFFFTTQNA